MAELSIEDIDRKTRDLYQKGIAALERGNLDYAAELLTSVITSEPRFLLARSKLRQSQIIAAKSKKGGLGSQLKAMGPMGKVKSLLKKDPAAALLQAEKLMAIDPLSKQHLFAYADAAEASGVHEAGVMTLQMAKDTFSKDKEYLTRLGDLLSNSGNKIEARNYYEMVHHLDPTDQQALKRFKDSAAVASMDTGGWNNATDYRDVIKDKDVAEKLEQESKAKKSDSDIHSLIADTIAKIEKDPRNLDRYRTLARLYTESQQLEEASDTLTKANEIAAGSDPTIERALQESYLRIYDFNIKQLKDAPDCEAELAEMIEEKTAYQIEIASERVEKYPNDLQAKFDYGKLLIERGEINTAIQMFQASQRHPQRRLESLYNLGRCFKAKEQYDIAAEQLKTAASEIPVMDDTKMNVFYELGTLYEAMGDIDEAMKYYKDIYARDIGYRDIADKIDSGYKRQKEQNG